MHDDWLKNVITHIGDEDNNNYFPISYFKKQIKNYKVNYSKKLRLLRHQIMFLKNLRKNKNKIYLIEHQLMRRYLIKKTKKSKIITFNISGSNVFCDQNKGFNHIDKIWIYQKSI